MPVGTYFLANFQVEDDGGTLAGGSDFDTTSRVLDANVVHVNQAPVGTSATLTRTLNTPYTLKSADFGFTDPNDSPPENTMLGVKITLLSTGGTLTDNGIAVTTNQIIGISIITSGKLVYTPNANLPHPDVYFLSKFRSRG